MKYYTIKPSEKLRSFVRYFWVFEGEASPDQPFIHRTMASGCPELLFHYKGAFDELSSCGQITGSFTSGIHGQSATHKRFINTTGFGMFGVYLYPHAIPLLFSIPSTELTNEMPDLETLFKTEGNDLEEQMMLAQDNTTRFNIVSAFLEKHISGISNYNTAIASCIETVIKSNGNIRIPELAYHHALSARQFERNFKSYSGFTPKLFSRIIRFHSAIKEFGNNQKSLTEIGYECGYYDQSHFIHDFKSFSGYHPKHYFSGKGEGVAHRQI